MIPASPPATPVQRLQSLDAFRGVVMLFLAVNAFGLAALAKATNSPVLDRLGALASHAEWISATRLGGVAPWDLIQPAFMFIVGVAVPFSFAKRRSLGHGRARILRHSLGRSLALILLGVFLVSARAAETNWSFINVLSQIGLGYSFLVLLAERPYRTHLITGAGVLFAIWLAYALYPVSAPPPGAAAEGDARMLSGFFGHWSFNRNAGWAFDGWFLNLFPRATPFEGNSGGYVTLNFIPAFVTMLMGLTCGQILRDERFSTRKRMKMFALGGAACLSLGVLAGHTVCPVVKRLWTPSWTLVSGAYVVWLLALFHWMIDVRGWTSWAFPLMIAGTKPMAMYLMGSLSRDWVIRQLHIHLPGFLFSGPWGHVADATLAGLVFWLICFWMYRRRIFLRL